LFSSCINNRLIKWIIENNKIYEPQGGSCRGRGTHEQITIINLLCDAAQKQNKPQFFIFFDVKKAFDSVWREGLIYKLFNEGIEIKLLKIISNMFKNVKNNIKIHNNLSKTYETTRGTLQGDPISPTLFIFFLNDLCKRFQDAKIGFRIDTENGILYINNRLY